MTMVQYLGGLLALVAIDCGICYSCRRMFSEKGFILSEFPSWKGTKKFKKFQNIFDLTMFSNTPVFTILYLCLMNIIPKDLAMGLLLGALLGTGILLSIGYTIFFAIERKKEKKRSKILKFKISEHENNSISNDPKI